MTERAQFQFWTQWIEDDPYGGTREYGEYHLFSDLDTAKRAHRSAVSGSWVDGPKREPHVSALKVLKWGRVLAEELQPKASWCESHGRMGCGCETGRRAA